MWIELNREDAALKRVLLLLLLMLTIGQLAHGQPTSSQVSNNNRSQSSSFDSQHENSLMENPVKMFRMKLLSAIFDDLSRELERPSVSSTERTETKQIETNCSHSEKNDAKEKVGILVQQHSVGTIFFNRSWAEYKVGFGDVNSNYWIGNDRLHNLTKDGRYKLRVDLLSKYNNRWYWAEYQTFRVLDESAKYVLWIGNYSGTATDRLQYANGWRFETRDNYYSGCGFGDSYGSNGGFWYNNRDCSQAVYINSPHTSTAGFTWLYLGGMSSWSDSKLVVSRMTLFPK